MKNIENFKKKVSAILQLVLKIVSNQLKKDSIYKLFTDYSNIMYVTPGSIHSNSIYCKEGGWILYVYDVISMSMSLLLVMKKSNILIDFNMELLFTSALLFNIGNLGTSHLPLILKLESTYKIGIGFLYRYNPEISYMKTYDRSLLIINNYGIKLTENLYLGIRLFYGLYEESDSIYFNMFRKLNESQKMLPYIINTAITLINLKKVKVS